MSPPEVVFSPAEGGRRPQGATCCSLPGCLLAALGEDTGADGSPFLGADLVGRGRRLREDFLRAQMALEPDWMDALDGAGSPDTGARAPTREADAARARLREAIAILGAAAGDVTLRACCGIEGLARIEKSMGWTPNSGKFVLRAGLQALERHAAGMRSDPLSEAG